MGGGEMLLRMAGQRHFFEPLMDAISERRRKIKRKRTMQKRKG